MGLFDKKDESAEDAENVAEDVSEDAGDGAEEAENPLAAAQEQLSAAGKDSDKPGVGPIIDRVLGFDESGKSSADRGVEGVWNKIVEGREAPDTSTEDESMPLPPEE